MLHQLAFTFGVDALHLRHEDGGLLEFVNREGLHLVQVVLAWSKIQLLVTNLLLQLSHGFRRGEVDSSVFRLNQLAFCVVMARPYLVRFLSSVVLLRVGLLDESAFLVFITEDVVMAWDGGWILRCELGLQLDGVLTLATTHLDPALGVPLRRERVLSWFWTFLLRFLLACLAKPVNL